MLRVLTKRRVRRRITTQVTRISKVLPRRKKRNVFPLQPGDDPVFRKPLLQRTDYPSTKYAEFLTEVYHVYWMVLHAITFLVPVYRNSSSEMARRALHNIADFMDALPRSAIFGCKMCSLHYSDFVERARYTLNAAQPLHHMALEDGDPYALAKWLIELHNDIHIGRTQSGGGHAAPPRNPVPFERVRAFYEEKAFSGCTPTADYEDLTIIEAFLQSQYGLKLRSDFVSHDIVHSTEKPLNKHYIHIIGIKLKQVYPNGYYRHYWHRVRHIHNTDSMLIADVFTGEVVNSILCAVLLQQLLSNYKSHGRQRAANIGYAAAVLLLFAMAYADVICKKESAKEKEGDAAA